MHTIKFSHHYNKMPSEEWIPNIDLEAKVLEVFIAEKKDLSPAFIKYDTEYGFLSYPLPNGKVLVIILITGNSSGNHVWTTVRRWTPSKEKYYRSIRGELVKIEVIKNE